MHRAKGVKVWRTVITSFPAFEDNTLNNHNSVIKMKNITVKYFIAHIQHLTIAPRASVAFHYLSHLLDFRQPRRAHHLLFVVYDMIPGELAYIFWCCFYK